MHVLVGGPTFSKKSGSPFGGPWSRLSTGFLPTVFVFCFSFFVINFSVNISRYLEIFTIFCLFSRVNTPRIQE